MQIQIFKKQKTKKIKKENFKINVDFYWKLILSMAFLLIMVSFVFGFYLFRQINKEQILSTSGGSDTALTMEKKRIEKVLEYFSEREKKSADILNSPSSVVDPSL